MKKQFLLVAEEQRAYIELIKALEKENFNVHSVSKIQEAIAYLHLNNIPEIILIDSTNCDIVAYEFCHAIKSNPKFRGLLVVFISDNKSEYAEVAAFHAHADDYILKPVKPQAFIERINTRLNKEKKNISIQAQFFGSSQLRIDRESYSAFLGNKLLTLSRKEFELLFLMASHPGKLFRREELFEKVWNRKMEENNRSIDVHILHLRKKLGDDFIQTQKGVGYRLTA